MCRKAGSWDPPASGKSEIWDEIFISWGSIVKKCLSEEWAYRESQNMFNIQPS